MAIATTVVNNRIMTISIIMELQQFKHICFLFATWNAVIPLKHRQS